jgi:type IV pilus assembly protein PilX
MRAMRGRRLSSSPRRGQRGIALAIALILLVVITLVGMAAVRGTIMQQKMTSNYYDREVAFQATEAALRQGEAAVLAASGPSAFRDCTATSANKCVPNPFTDTTVTPVSVPTTAFSGTLAAAPPQYVVEYLGNFTIPPPSVHQISNCSGYAPCGVTYTANFYRITARSGPADVDGRATVTLQTIYRH